MFSGSILFFLQWVDTLILGVYTTESNIGIYNLAVKISLLSSIFLFAINSIAAPKFSELFYSGKINELKQIIRISTKIIFYFSLPLVLTFLIIPEKILVIFGEEYRYAKWSLIYLTIGQFINSCSGSVGYILQMTGKQFIFQNIVFFSMAINVFLNLILIPIYDIVGAAIASMISMAMWNILGIIFIYKKHGFISCYFPSVLINRVINENS